MQSTDTQGSSSSSVRTSGSQALPLPRHSTPPCSGSLPLHPRTDLPGTSFCLGAEQPKKKSHGGAYLETAKARKNKKKIETRASEWLWAAEEKRILDAQTTIDHSHENPLVAGRSVKQRKEGTNAPACPLAFDSLFFFHRSYQANRGPIEHGRSVGELIKKVGVFSFLGWVIISC